MKKLKLLSVLILAIAMNSCRKDYLQVEKIVPPSSNLSFATDILPLINSYACAKSGCHNGGIPCDLRPANAYSSINNAIYIDLATPSASLLYIAVNDPLFSPFQMPDGGPYLTNNEKATLLAWISQGAKP